MKINTVYLKGQENVSGWNNPNKIIIHHPEWYGDIYGLNDLMRGMNYSMVGYNYYVRKDGSIWKGRPDNVTGANCYGENHSSLGVCFEGNYEKDPSMPDAQFQSGVELIKYLMNKYGISEVGGHKKYYNTACPGKNFPLSQMIDAVKGGSSSNPAPSVPDSSDTSTPINANATIINDFLWARNSSGTKVGGYASIGDNVQILDVSYSKQLVELIYPTPSGSKHRYATNATNCIKYHYQDQWRNGSTAEPVYEDSTCTKKIGALDPWERATPLYRKNGVLHVVYDTDKGENTKSGFVKYNGSFTAF